MTPCRSIFLLLAAFCLTGCHRSQTAPALPGTAHPAYTITDLGEGTPTAVNNRGQVVGRFDAGRCPQSGLLGFIDNYPITHGFLWSEGKRTEMPTLGGWNSYATDLDDAGHVLGDADINKNDKFGYGASNTCVWDGHTLTDLDSDPRFSQVQKLHLTPSGAIYALSPSQAPKDSQYLWFYPQGAAAGPRLNCGKIGDGSVSNLALGTAISDTGTVVGLWDSGQTGKDYRSISHLFIWHPGDKHRTIVGPLSGPEFTPEPIAPNAISRASQVIGTIEQPRSSYHAAFWERGQVHKLGTLSGGVSSSARAINACGQIVGFSDASTGKNSHSHAVLWEQGKIRDLSQLIPSGTQWSRLENGVDINDQGQIVGEGYFAGNPHVHSYLLTPITPVVR